MISAVFARATLMAAVRVAKSLVTVVLCVSALILEPN